jgi:hypothetical protein
MSENDGEVSAVVTVELLEALGACEDYRDLFRERLGTEAITVTPELCERYHDDFLWSWAVDKLLLPAGRSAYCPAFDDSDAPCACSRDSRRSARRFGEVAVRYGIVTLEEVLAGRSQEWST